MLNPTAENVVFVQAVKVKSYNSLQSHQVLRRRNDLEAGGQRGLVAREEQTTFEIELSCTSSSQTSLPVSPLYLLAPRQITQLVRGHESCDVTRYFAIAQRQVVVWVTIIRACNI